MGIPVLQQPQGFGEMFGKGLGQGLETGMPLLMKQIGENRKAKNFSAMMQGMAGGGGGGEAQNPFTAIMNDPVKFAQASAAGYGDMVKTGAEHAYKQQEQREKRATETAPFESALEIVNRQKELLEGGNIGAKASWWGGSQGELRKRGSTFTPEGRADRAEYEQAGKSLIAIASGMKGGMKGKEQFETFSKKLFDSTLKKSEIRGALRGMESIIRGNLRAHGINPQQSSTPQGATGQPEQARKSLSTPQTPQFQVGQQFQGLPPTAPEGAVFNQGGKRSIFRNGQWSPL